MAELIIEDNRDGYREVVDYILMNGREQKSRNGDTLEVDELTLHLLDPTKAIPCGIGRKNYSYALAYLEGLQLVAGETYDDLMVKVAPNTARFREDDNKFHGAYGRRLGEQIGPTIEKLKADPDTRQAFVNIWDWRADSEGGKRDHPCTLVLGWRIRNNKLLATTTMRSADAHWGEVYDVPMFAMLQLSIAHYLDVEPGTYTHRAVSFHAYTKDVDALSALTPWDGTDVRVGPVGDDAVDNDWSDVQNRARSLVFDASTHVDQPLPPLWSDDEARYANAIRARLL